MRKVLFLLCAFMVSGCSSLRENGRGGDEGSIVRREYREGAVLKYRITGKGTNTPDYYGEAESVVRKDEDGVFYEELRWTAIEKDGKKTEIPSGFRQVLSLDPAFKQRMPSLFHGPILDTMTFYVDEMLAIGKSLSRKGERVYIEHGGSNSWADGGRVLTGYDCIDFEITLEKTDKDKAVVLVRHLPPPQGCTDAPPADWMRDPVADTKNNWFQVMKLGESRYAAGVAKEVFDVRLEILLPSGIISRATMNNPLTGRNRVCRDGMLTDCSPAVDFTISREIVLELLENS
jgi:hypothetical protein